LKEANGKGGNQEGRPVSPLSPFCIGSGWPAAAITWAQYTIHLSLAWASSAASPALRSA